MELHLTFRGMCVFAPSADRTFVDVIFPETRGSGHAEHHPVLESAGIPAREPMRDFRLDFTALGARAKIPEPIPGVYDIGSICGPIPSDHLLDQNPNARVVSRVRVPAPDRPLPGLLVAFQVGANPADVVWLTHEYTFIYDNVTIQDGTFTCQPIRPTNPLPRPVKRPLPTGTNPNVLTVVITHIPNPGHIPNPCPGDVIDHVHLYYQYLSCAGPDLILLSHNPACGQPLNPRTALTSLAFNCMLGQAPPT